MSIAMNTRSSSRGGHIESSHVAVAEMNGDRMAVVDIDGVAERIMDGVDVPNCLAVLGASSPDSEAKQCLPNFHH